MTGRTVTALAGLLLVAGCGAPAAGNGPADDGPDGRMVLVSGRDDHGELAEEVVVAYDGPGSTTKVGGIPDGTLAHVIEVDGTWLRVVTAEEVAVDGWVDDYYLRGTAHLVGPAPSCEPVLGGRTVEAGLPVVVSQVRGAQVLVSAADGDLRGWVARPAVQELPPQGTDCSGEPGEHTH
jgi:hypothetical protein